jgi:hypothetical protein
MRSAGGEETRRLGRKLGRTSMLGLAMATAFVLAACAGGGEPAERASAPPAELVEPSTDGASATAVASAPASTAPSPPIATECGTYSGQGCAPESDRVDLEPPSFSNPTRITNPLFPIGQLQSVVLLGQVDGKPFRSETTLLPETQTVTWGDQEIEVLLSQYTAYLDGRLDEVALDRYAQADDGSVWYLGEDVYDYRRGAVAVTEGTWLAGRDGPPAMIMPADPGVGDVFRAENVIGVVFEEVTVDSVGNTVDGPRGPIEGAIVAQELHLDGATSNKTFAPGYGEFYTASDGEVEALALAVPTDALGGPPPPDLEFLSTSAWGILENARLGDWDAATATLTRMTKAWSTVRASNQPPRIEHRMGDAISALTGALRAERVRDTSQAAIDVAQSALDLELRYRPPAEIDAERFHLWSQQLRVDAAARDLAGVTGDVAVLEWIRDRIAHTLDAKGRAEIDTRLRDLRAATDARNLAAAGDHAARLAARLRTLAGA